MAVLNDMVTLDRLPAMPSTMARLVPMLMNADVDLDALERVLRQDEALTMTVLRLANSVQYGGRGSHHDLRRSMSRLGLRTLRQCVMSQQVAGAIGGANAALGMERGALWRSALAGALAAEELARRHQPDDAPMAFVCALLRDIGKLALNVKFGGAYLAAIAPYAHEGLSFDDTERAALGFDHAQIGGALARHWGLPERIARAVETHHAPPPPGPDHDPLFDVVHAADAICRWAGFGIGFDGMEYRLAEHVRDGLSLDRRTVEREIARLQGQLRDALEALGETLEQGTS